MQARRRIDWSEITGADAPIPVWRDAPAPSELVSLLLAFGDLFVLQDPDAILRRAVELALDPVGLVRAGAYLYDEPLELMLGTWGTDLDRKIADEHHAAFRLSQAGRRVFDRALAGEAHWTLVDDCPIIANDARATTIVGRGWVVCTPIRSGRALIGMLYNDAGLTDTPVDPARQARAAALCAVVGMLLDGVRQSRGISSVAALTGRHPAVAEALRMLGRDPSLSGAQIASELDVSPSRFARVFKSQVGVSLVDYRNRLRLERFMALIDAGGTNLLESALAAGFGSYAQFHRVFHALRGATPRDYLAHRGAPSRTAPTRSPGWSQDPAPPPSPGSPRR